MKWRSILIQSSDIPRHNNEGIFQAHQSTDAKRDNAILIFLHYYILLRLNIFFALHLRSFKANPADPVVIGKRLQYILLVKSSERFLTESRKIKGKLNLMGTLVIPIQSIGNAIVAEC